MLYLSHEDGRSTACTSLALASAIVPKSQKRHSDRHYSQRLASADSMLRHFAHVACYFVMTVFSTLAGGFAISVVFGGLLAITDEFSKGYVVGRHCHIYDIGLNLVGVWLGCFALFVADMLMF